MPVPLCSGALHAPFALEKVLTILSPLPRIANNQFTEQEYDDAHSRPDRLLSCLDPSAF
jgi:hypothetical protein